MRSISTYRSSIAFARWAVVTLVTPPARGLSSTTMTDFPAVASMYAVERPEIPAPTTQTFACRLSPSVGKVGTLVVAVQLDWCLASMCDLVCMAVTLKGNWDHGENYVQFTCRYLWLSIAAGC